ncbi:MAG TPA: hypothetical protein VJQ06_05195 [Rhizomicrobium sp.]|nr:hypothetical protein [Rhizomicrobium sp.]
MANAQAICNSFKSEVLSGIHALGTTVTRGGTGADTIKAALYLASASIGAGTTAYSSTGEVTGTNYSAGGVTVTNATAPTLSSSTAVWTPSASIVFTTVTLSTAFDCVLLYNSTQSNKAISAHTFGSQTITAGTLTLTMPVNDFSNALVRIA